MPGSTLEFGLDGATASQNGEFISSASDTLAGTLDVVLENGFQPTIGETFQLLSFTTESGQFSSLDFPPGYTFDTSALYTQGTITVTSVPEPASVGLLLLISAGFVRRGGRNKSTHLCY